MPEPIALRFDPAELQETCDRIGIRLLVLFGSRASGSPPPMPDSDLDLAVAMADGQILSFWDALTALAALFPDETLDLVQLRDADPLFRWEILRSGVLLFGDPLEYLELRAFAFRDFVDSADLRALERTLSVRKLARIRALIHAAS